MKIGDKLKGRITGIQPYGAFVELETGVIGLIHISEIRTGFIENIYEVLKIGEEVQVQVVDLDEFSEELYNIRGALSMANAGPNTNGSQFFIVQNQHLPYSKKEIARGGWPEPIAEIYAEQGGTPHLDRRHTVFGQLADEASYEVLDAIAGVETGAMDKPVEDVVIETIEIED